MLTFKKEEILFNIDLLKKYLKNNVVANHRSWIVFFKNINITKFPKTLIELEEKISYNYDYYLINYIIIFLLILTYNIYYKPKLIFVLLIITFIILYFLYLNTKLLILGEEYLNNYNIKLLTIRNYIILTLVVLLLLFTSTLELMLKLIFLWIFICFFHLVLHEPILKLKTEDDYTSYENYENLSPLERNNSNFSTTSTLPNGSYSGSSSLSKDYSYVTAPSASLLNRNTKKMGSKSSTMQVEEDLYSVYTETKNDSYSASTSFSETYSSESTIPSGPPVEETVMYDMKDFNLNRKKRKK